MPYWPPGTTVSWTPAIRFQSRHSHKASRLLGFTPRILVNYVGILLLFKELQWTGSIGHLLIIVFNSPNDCVHPGALCISIHHHVSEGTTMGGSGLINWSHSTPQLLMCMASVQFAQSGRNETHPRRDRNNVKWKNAPPSSQQEPEIQCRLSTWLRGRQGMIMGLHSWTRQKGMTGMLKEDLGLSISGNSKGGT